MTNTYVGSRGVDPAERVSVHIETATGLIYQLIHYVHHSPTGFEWGYAGSGPADLALSILVARAIKGEDNSQALRLHQAFKFHFVARFANDAWRLSEAEIDDWIEKRDAHA